MHRCHVRWGIFNLQEPFDTDRTGPDGAHRVTTTTTHHTASHCTTTHHTAPHHTTLHYITLHHTASHSTTPHCTTPHCTAPQHTAPQHTTSHCTTSHCTTLYHKTPHHLAGLDKDTGQRLQWTGQVRTREKLLSPQRKKCAKKQGQL